MQKARRHPKGLRPLVSVWFQRYDELRDERNKLYIDAIPYLEEALKIDPSNFNAAKTLSNIFSATSDGKYKHEPSVLYKLKPSLHNPHPSLLCP